MATRKTKAAVTQLDETSQTKGAAYIDELRLDYSLYVMQQRAIVSESDGLKPAGRRLLYTGRSGSQYKTQNLAAATMPLHPHGSPDDVVNTLTAPFINNVPLFQGIGIFGTLVEPKAFGATRYTDVKLSRFTKDVVFADQAIIPMVDNYDQTLKEPAHFLPLVPVSLLNPSDGIAIGFTSNILPRALGDVVSQQIAYLQGKKVKNIAPESQPTGSVSEGQDENDRWIFNGKWDVVAHNKINVTTLPFDLTHKEFNEHLISLKENEVIVDFRDDSKETIAFEITFKKGELKTLDDDDLLRILKLQKKITERIIMVATTGRSIVERTFPEAIKAFCDWRLTWFVNRYEYLKGKHEDELQYVKDYLLTVDSGMAAKFTAQKSKDALEEALRKLGVVNDERIARLPAYSFTKAEYDKMMARKKELEALIKECVAFLKSEQKRKDQYILELQEIAANNKKGLYATQV